MKKSIGRILLTFLMMAIALSVNAQSKPKRDTSKDRSAVVAKKQKENVAPGTTKPQPSVAAKTQKENTVHGTSKSQSVLVAKHGKQNKYKRRKRNKVRKTSASYLTVNRETASLTSTLSIEGGKLFFDVSTDGKGWAILSLPSWCKVTKFSNYFLLEYAANPTNNERRDWFVVKCDSKEVRVNITQPATPCEFMAKVTYAYLRHNVFSSVMGCYCLEIHATVTIAGGLGENCSVDAYFLDKDRRYVVAKSGYSSYALSTSNPIVCVSTKITPSTNNSQSYDVVYYLPNNALDLKKKKNKLCCEVSFWQYGKGYVPGASYPVYFKAKSKNGIVMTESY